MFGSVAIHGGLVLSALAAVVKPVLFGGLPSLNGYFGAAVLLRVGEGVDSLSFVFEYLLGVGVQIYLVLLCFAWVRGLTFDFDALRRFALRRFAFVVKWAVVVIVHQQGGDQRAAGSSRSFRPAFDPRQADWTDGMIHATRWLLSTLPFRCFAPCRFFSFSTTNLCAERWEDHFRLLCRHGGHGLAGVIVAPCISSCSPWRTPSCRSRWARWTWPAAGWNLLVHPLLWTALAGWFVASWVCLFRRCERNQPDADELVRF